MHIDNEGNVEYEVYSGDSILDANHGSPIIAFIEGKAMLCCIKGH